MQNLLPYAMTRKAAAELVTARANREDPHFGLRHWKRTQVRKQDVWVAKTYLSECEIATPNRLMAIFLETAELRTKSRHSNAACEANDELLNDLAGGAGRNGQTGLP